MSNKTKKVQLALPAPSGKSTTPTNEEITEAQRVGEEVLAERRAANERRLKVMDAFTKKIELAQKEAMTEGYYIGFYVGTTAPNHEIGVKISVRELTPEEKVRVTQLQVQAANAETPNIPL